MLQDKTLLGLLLAVVFMMVGGGMVMPQLPQVVADFDGSGHSVGYIASAFAVSYLLLQIPIGSLADRIGCKSLLVLGYLLCALTGLVFYYATSANMIFFGRLVQGIGEAPIWALAPALLSARFPLTKGRVIGIYSAAMHVGLALGPILGVILMRMVSQNAVFIAYSAGCLAGAFIIFLLVEDANIVTKSECQLRCQFNISDLVRLVKTGKTLLVLLGITLYGSCYGIFHTNIPFFLLEERNYAPTHIGMFFSLFYAALSFSQVIAGPVSDRIERIYFMIAGLITVAGALAVLPICSLPWALLVVLIAGGGMGVFYLASMAYLHEIVPESLKGTISGAYFLFWGGGYFSGPLLMTQAVEFSGFQAALMGCSLLTVLVAAGMLLVPDSQEAARNGTGNN
ncbi:MAG TPA: MFS transporter [Patescibacteria group bacterium]|nr:MFS transporter [Patescibacteria group bacterium]